MTENLTSRWVALVLSGLMLLVALSVSADRFTEERVIKAEVAEKLQPRIYGAQVLQDSMPVMTRRLDSLLKVKAWVPGDPIRFVPKRVYPASALGPPANPTTWQVDPLLAIQEGAKAPTAMQSGRIGAPTVRIATPIVNIPGQSFTGVYPPDTVGDVGPNHYIQAINSGGGGAVQAYDKAGVTLFGPVNFSGLGSGLCATGLGDPIVLYDRAADRWLLSEFSGVGNALCVYVSETPDPGGAYFAYEFNTPNFPDYPKYSVWSDAYYVSTNEGGGSSTVYALDRTAMLAGIAATSQRFTTPVLAGFGFQALTPADLDGSTPVPAGAPGYFMRHRDDEAHNPGSNDPAADFLEIWELDVDFVTPANSTFTGPTSIPITEIDSELCGFVSFNCFQQPNGQRLDPLREVVMWRLQYRNFGAHQTLVGNLTTDVDGTDRGGIRWFELRDNGGGWSLFQEGTYSPDTDNRWMGSIAMDKDGNIAVGYSVTSLTQPTDMRYAGRLATDAVGTLPDGEHTLVSGAGSQAIERWGDYSAMSVDPSDDCTFWHTNEFVTGSNLWATQIGSFKFPSCTAGPPPVCGDGVIALPEACDDMNMADGDGCSSSCQIESGFVCVGEPSVCTIPPPPVCGDGVIELPEVCDDMNMADGDGCSSSCQVESGFMCTGEPSVCVVDASGTCLDENFEAPNLWTEFNTGVLNFDWGTTDDGVCWSANLGPPPAVNVTGGAGVAACVDSDAAGLGQVESYLCTQQFQAGSGTIDLDFLYNYQIFSLGADDSFEVLVGTAPPSAATIGGYANVFSTNSNAGSFASPPGVNQNIDLTAFAGSEVHVCFGYRGNFDWYAQVDDVTVVASEGCDGPDTDGDGIPDNIDPDDDNDGIGDVFDTDPLVPSNSCTGGDSDNATMAEDVITQRTCAATQSVSVIPPAAVTDPGELTIIAPRVIIESPFSAVSLIVISADPCPGCSP